MAARNDPELETRAALASLAHGCAVEAEIVTTSRRSSQLLHRPLLHAPARTLEPRLERLEARSKGKFIVVTLADKPDLARLWDTAARKVLDGR